MAWFCPYCELPREDGQPCPRDGVFREDIVPVREAEVEETPWTAIVQQERDPVPLPTYWPVALWMAALFVLAGISAEIITVWRPNSMVGMSTGIGIFAVLILLGVLGRLQGERLQQALQQVLRPLRPIARPFLVHHPECLRLIVQRQEDGAPIGLQMDDPTPWALGNTDAPLEVEGRWEGVDLATARRLTRAGGRQVLATARRPRDILIALAGVGIYLLLAAYFRWP